MELDMRSSDPASLAAVDASIQEAIDAAVAEENARWGKPGTITVVKELVGDRPAGSTPESAAIVKNGIAVATVLGLNANLGEGSTDSNLPMSLKIPAITIGGGEAGAAAGADHRLQAGHRPEAGRLRAGERVFQSARCRLAARQALHDRQEHRGARDGARGDLVGRESAPAGSPQRDRPAARR